MTNRSSEDRLIRNEMLLRAQNKSAKNGIKKYFGNNRSTKEAVLEFACECSDLNCGETVRLSIADYEKIHKRNDRFAIAPGHKTAAIENVVAKERRYEIVEKDSLPA